MKYTIYPYVSKWQTSRVWVFDDPAKGLINEGLVSGTDVLLDRLAAQFPNGEKGFALTFSDKPFKGHQLAFDWQKSDTGRDLAEGCGGNWYTEQGTGHECWLCPALFKYFDKAPTHIYVMAAAIEGELKHGTGEVVIQGK